TSFSRDWSSDVCSSDLVSDAVNSSAQAILENINRAVVINPVSLLSLILLATPKHTLDEEICIKQLDTYRTLLAALPYDERMEVKIGRASGREGVWSWRI